MKVGPESHGSTRIEKTPALEADDGDWRRGAKVKRKEESPLRCLTVSDMT